MAETLIDQTAGTDLVQLFREDPLVASVKETLSEIAGPDLEVNLYGPDAVLQQRFDGIDGFIAAWRDWTEPFSDFSWTRKGSSLQRGNVLINFVEQRATIAGTQGSVTAQSAAIWHFTDDAQLRRIDFHLDREIALQKFEEQG